MKIAFALAMGLLMGSSASAQDKSPRGQAQWLLERLTGVHWPANTPLLTQMADQVARGDNAGAADLAMQQPQFLNVTVKQMALAISTREETSRLSLNDFAAAFIGVTRDGIDARELLYGNYYYAADPSLIPASVPSGLVTDILTSNNHYVALDVMNLNFGAVLKRYDGQMLANGDGNTTIANPDPAGVLTSRTWLQAHAVAGTNRRLVEYTFREFMCIPLINWADTQGADERVGRDVDRSPGGDPMKYATSCKGCHAMQDSFRGAFAKWDWNQNGGLAAYVGAGGTGRAIASADPDHPGVLTKMNQNNSVFPDGFVTTDDSWVNHATRGINAGLFGWRGMAPDGAAANSGHGANQFGRLVANSQRFSQCMAKHVFQAVCKHDLNDTDAELLYVSLGLSLEANHYNLKQLFAMVAVHPKCRL